MQTGEHSAEVAAYREWRIGDNVHVHADETPSMDYLLPVSLPQAETDYALYIRVQSNSTVALVGSVHDISSIVSRGQLSILFNGGYLLVTLLMALINLLFFLRLRDTLYLTFALYIFALFVTHSSLVGVLKLLFPGHVHHFSDYVTGCGLGVTLSTYSLFMINLFQMRPRQWPRTVFVGFACFGAVVVVSVPAGLYATVAPIMAFCMMLAVILPSILSVGLVRRGEPQGWLYIVAFGLSNLGYCAQLLRVQGLIPAQWWNESPVQVATLLNVALMTLALTERLRMAEHKALVAAREAEHKAVKLATGMTAELRASLAKEQQVMRRLTRFLSMLSHEYRTPLAIIQANVDVMALENPAETPIGRKLESMKHAVHRLADLLEVSLREERRNNFQGAPKHVPVKVTNLLDEVLDQAEGFWPERTFIFTPPESEDMLICGDTEQLRTAVLNLLDNAQKYSPATTPILIQCDIARGYVEVSITDHGQGCTTDDIDLLFAKYQRGANSQGIGGAGLGLWIVRQIAEQHGGSIILNAHDQGGTRATLKLPTPDAPCNEPRSASEEVS
ncbi:MAG: 7TM diverse intracellular signaling domain-containing protein [Desulfobulbus sp.]